MRYFIYILFGVAVALHLFACFPPVKQNLRKFTKCLLMPLLALSYALTAPSPSMLVVGALLLGWVGDVFLIFPKKPVCFSSGLAAFAAGHVMYIIYILTHLSGRPPVWIIMLAVCLYAGAILLLMSRLISYLPQRMLVPSAVYMVLIAFMSLSTLLFALTQTGIAATLVFIGSLMFLISDTVLSFVTFKQEFSWHYLCVMSTYIAAQTFIAFGLATSGVI